jgi:hypothetical protein
VTYTLDLEVPVTVEVVHAERGSRGGPWEEPEPDSVELRVTLGTLDITAALPPDVLAGLEGDALERLRRAADEP